MRDLEATLVHLRTALRRGDAAGRREAFASLAAAGARSAEFTVMVRWLVEDGLECAWDDLEGMSL